MLIIHAICFKANEIELIASVELQWSGVKTAEVSINRKSHRKTKVRPVWKWKCSDENHQNYHSITVDSTTKLKRAVNALNILDFLWFILNWRSRQWNVKNESAIIHNTSITTKTIATHTQANVNNNQLPTVGFYGCRCDFNGINKTPCMKQFKWKRVLKWKTLNEAICKL